MPPFKHIHIMWAELRRDNTDILDIAKDPKWKLGPNGRYPVYVSRQEDPVRALRCFSGSLLALG